MKLFAAVVVALGTLMAAPSEADAAKALCEATGKWTSPTTQDTWTFRKCRDTVDVVRYGGKSGTCTSTYPYGSWHREAAQTCYYTGPL
ncbi:MAG: hypothetical protein E6R04_03705 [Spirochaetes bacterium]|nr:MAG: hypothetical protein E6R04_03705 [Spirochaetota bacterium]